MSGQPHENNSEPCLDANRAQAGPTTRDALHSDGSGAGPDARRRARRGRHLRPRASYAGSRTSRSRGWPRPARRSTPSTSTRCPTATPAPTCSSPWSRPATRWPSARRRSPDDLRAAMQAYSPGRPARRPRQLGRDPEPARRRAAPPRRPRPARTTARRRCSPRGWPLATEAAYAAVGEPVEGTILSVARAASRGRRAGGRRRGEARLGDVIHAAAQAAARRWPAPRSSCRCSSGPAWSTPAAAGCASSSTPPSRRSPASAPPRPRRTSARRRSRWPLPTGDLTEGGPAYEVMYLLEADDDAIPPLREQLAPLGDSLVVVGGEGLWNVHVHVDDVGAAVEAGIRAGRPRRIEVTHFAEQVARARREARRAARSQAGDRRRPVRGWRALRDGRCRRDRGWPGPAARAPAQILDGDRGDRCAGGDRAAQRPGLGRRRRGRCARRREESGVHVVVIPTRAQVQGIAALAVHEPGRPLDSDVVQMAAAARGARTARSRSPPRTR